MRTRLNTQIITSRIQLDEKMSTATTATKPAKGPETGKSSLNVQRSSVTSASSVEDDDFADFNLADAKKYYFI